MAAENNTRAWDQHWEAGYLSSLSQSNQTTESPEAIAGWNAFFEKLSDGATILDICTGNGIVPAHAGRYAKEAGVKFAITGIDQARIDPLNRVKEGREMLEGVNFMGGVGAEALPFPDAAFDAVTGQYAIEYTEIEKTAPEVARVLKPGGRARFVIHAREGILVTFNMPKADQYDFILNKSGVLEVLGEAIRLSFEFEASGDPAIQTRALEARAKFKETAVRARAGVLEIAVIEESLTLLDNLVHAFITRRQFKDMAGFEAWLSGIRDQIEGQVAMIRSFGRAALGKGDLEKITIPMGNAGLKIIKIDAVRVDGKHLHAWTIEAEKA